MLAILAFALMGQGDTTKHRYSGQPLEPQRIYPRWEVSRDFIVQDVSMPLRTSA